MAGQVLRAWTTPPGMPVPDGLRVSAAAARSRSTTAAGPAPGQAAPTERALPAHRQAQAPARRQGRAR
ncbi:hypothetical protein ACFXPI_03530 [Streptomyces sp. NPDC059104]|uniref:hypothetical protein n=1 Tax=Streptomyces sp. NPDC059104 TaxID=3346729 RepID=UPI0036BBBE3B